MRYITIAILCFASLFGSAWAQPKVSPLALVGSWTATEMHPSGVSITTVVKLSQNMKFSGLATVDSKPYMNFSGTWSVDGNTLKWRYEASSNPSIFAGFTDSDEITSVGPSELTLVSALSGKKRTYTKNK
jgi:hypothetical protein